MDELDFIKVIFSYFHFFTSATTYCENSRVALFPKTLNAPFQGFGNSHWICSWFAFILYSWTLVFQVGARQYFKDPGPQNALLIENKSEFGAKEVYLILSWVHNSVEIKISAVNPMCYKTEFQAVSKKHFNKDFKKCLVFDAPNDIVGYEIYRSIVLVRVLVRIVENVSC